MTASKTSGISVSMSAANIAYVMDNGLIYKAYIGDQNGDTIRKLWKTMDKLVKELREKKKPVLILVDLSKLGKTHLSARKIEVEFIRSLDFDKAAIFGDTLFTRALAKVILAASGMSFKIGFFNTQAEGQRWLLGV